MPEEKGEGVAKPLRPASAKGANGGAAVAMLTKAWVSMAEQNAQGVRAVFCCRWSCMAMVLRPREGDPVRCREEQKRAAGQLGHPSR